MLARILTENKNYTDIVTLVMIYFDSVTIIKAEGLWQREIEHSLIIEIICKDNQNDRHLLEQLAFDIKKHNKQDAVLVQYLQCESKLV